MKYDDFEREFIKEYNNYKKNTEIAEIKVLASIAWMVFGKFQATTKRDVWGRIISEEF